ncbi:MAG: N-acetylneuraminate synthase family protein [Nitrospirae bacterium]|nr:N-acetylneuraminate synthase family protein [Nitrospirota bacterium]
MLFIAEIGLNHNGNFSLAYEMIKQAKQAGADIAKFQLGWRCKEGEINNITPDILRKLKQWCDFFEIEFMVSIITPEAYEMVREIDFKTYKIASRTLKDDLPLVKRIVAEGKDTIVSLGMWDGANLPFTNDNVKYLWCKSKYPTEPWDLLDFPKDFRSGRFSGYSDHSIGIELPLLAITRGAKIIEKHFTLDKSDTTIRDHALSATPEEFSTMVRLGRDIFKKILLGI